AREHGRPGIALTAQVGELLPDALALAGTALTCWLKPKASPATIPRNRGRRHPPRFPPFWVRSLPVCLRCKLCLLFVCFLIPALLFLVLARWTGRSGRCGA